jgi:hypothetical protein
VDRLLSDDSFRTNLEERPVETLNEMGIVLDEAEAKKLFGRRFSEVYNEQTIQGIDREMVSKPMMAVAVVVGATTTT